MRGASVSEPTIEDGNMASRSFSRRAVLVALGGVAAGTLVSSTISARRYGPGASPRSRWKSYVADGTAGLAAAFPFAAVTLLESPFRANQSRNTSYLEFVDPDRLLH